MARLGTRAPSGRPHLVPVVFARHANALWSPVDAKPKRPDAPELARVRHVRAHPEVSVLLDHYDPDWQRLWWLRIDGRARLVAGAGDEAQAAAAALRAKYPQYARTPLFRGGRAPQLLRIEVERVRSWAASEAAVAVLVSGAR